MIRSSLIKSVFKHMTSESSLFGRRSLSSEGMSQFKTLKIVEEKEFVYNVQMNREKKLNALNTVMWLEIGEAFKLLGDDPDCRVIIFSGNGKAFCAGIDLNDLMKLGSVVNDDELDTARKSVMMFKTIKQFQNSFMEIEKCPKPVIAAIHGPCVGGGTNMVTFADIRYCTQDAWFQVKEAALGLCADVGALQRLPKLIGSQSLVRELCFTARKVDSNEAGQCGFVSKVFDDKESMMSAVIALAESIAVMSPVAVQGTKINLNYARDHSVEEGLDFVAHWNKSMLQSEDLMKAAMALMSKSEEPPQFAKL